MAKIKTISVEEAEQYISLNQHSAYRAFKKVPKQLSNFDNSFHNVELYNPNTTERVPAHIHRHEVDGVFASKILEDVEQHGRYIYLIQGTDTTVLNCNEIINNRFVDYTIGHENDIIIKNATIVARIEINWRQKMRKVKKTLGRPRMGKDRKIPFNIYLDPALLKLLRGWSKANGVSVARFIERSTQE